MKSLKNLDFNKHTGRVKEKILQNLGKVDRTADEIFDEHLNNFTKQQLSANKLQKEFNNYIRCVRALQTASKSLMDTVTEVYEEQWTGADALRLQASSIEVLFQDFSHKLGDQVLLPLNTYSTQFPEMRKKIEKRGRKLVDYDGQRHSFQSLQNNASKKKDDLKVSKSKEQLDEARRTYEILNTELHDELPALYDSRILFLVSNLQTFFASEQVFHCETARIFAELEAIVDKLATDSQKGSYSFKRIIEASPQMAPSSPDKNEAINGFSIEVNTSSTNNATEKGQSSPTYENANISENDNTNNVSDINKNLDNTASDTIVPSTLTSSVSVETNKEAIKDNNCAVDKPANALYKVKATYKYTKEDVDELSFEVGDIITVIEYDDPEEQEDGWLMGIKDGTQEKGLFPANFTKPL